MKIFEDMVCCERSLQQLTFTYNTILSILSLERKMLYLTTIVIAFLPAFVFLSVFFGISEVLESFDFTPLARRWFRRVLKPVPSHPLHFQYQNEEGSTTDWVYTYQYNGTDCETDKAALESVTVTNQCFTTESKTQDSNSSSSVMFTCFEGKVLFYSYFCADSSSTFV